MGTNLMSLMNRTSGGYSKFGAGTTMIRTDKVLQYITLDGTWFKQYNCTRGNGEHFDVAQFQFGRLTGINYFAGRLSTSGGGMFGCSNGYFWNNAAGTTSYAVESKLYNTYSTSGGVFYDVDSGDVIFNYYNGYSGTALVLFSYHEAYDYNTRFRGNIGRLSFYDANSTHVFDWTPMIKGGVVGFWDSVNNELVTDSSFVAGPEVVS